MNKILRALVISACATVAAGIVVNVISKKDASAGSNSKRLPPKEEDYSDLDQEQTEALVNELAAQV